MQSADIIQEFVSALPDKTAEKIASRLMTFDAQTMSRDQLYLQIERMVFKEKEYQLLKRLFATIEQDSLQPREIGIGMGAAIKMRQTLLGNRSTSVLISGPETATIPTRLNVEGLLELIHEAKKELLIVTFALYPVPRITQALREAVGRGVEVSLLIEVPQEGYPQKLNTNTLNNLGVRLAKQCKIYHWPMEARAYSSGTHTAYATVHAKIAVADRQKLFISSANLTQAAMKHNLEIGVLIKDGMEPQRVADHFQELIEKGEFVQLTEQEIERLAKK